MARDRELEWNIGAERVRTIGSLLHSLREHYAVADSNPTYGNVSDYHTMLKTLFMEIFGYIEEGDRGEYKDRLRGLKRRMKDSRRQGMFDDEAEEIMQELEEVDMALNEARIDAGLDIPASDKLDPESALVDGLRDG